MTKTYNVVCEIRLYDLIDQVNSLLQDGWTLYGELKISEGRWYQVLVKNRAKQIPAVGHSNKHGHTCSQCGEFHTHEELGTYKVLNPECPTCGWNTERDHHQRVQNQTS